MSRFFAFHANRPTRVDCRLVAEQNRLLAETHRDSLGRDHPDGWGAGYFKAGHPIIERNEGDGAIVFSRTAATVHSPTMIAHVRMGTVGVAGIHNCHPFRWGRWMFAHQGTLTAEASLRSELIQEMGEDFAGLIHGTSDSELVFHWLVSRLRQSGQIDAEGYSDREGMQGELGGLLGDLLHRNHQASPEQPAVLNVVLTNGEILFATRFGSAMYRLHRQTVEPCEVCGEPHIAPVHRDGYQATLLTSQPYSSEPWEEVPDRSLVTVAPDTDTSIIRLEARPNALS